MGPNDLVNASGQPNVQGALQQLLLTKIRSPQQVEASGQRRLGELARFQEELQSPPFGNYTPTEHGAYSWLENISKGLGPWEALAGGIGSGGKMLGEIGALEKKGRVESAKAGYEDAKSEDKMDIYELQALKGLAGGRQGLTPIVKMDKDGNMVVYDQLNGTTRVVHASQRGEYQRVFLKAYEKAVGENHPNPESYAHEIAANVLQVGPKAGIPEGGSGRGTPAVPTGGEKLDGVFVAPTETKPGLHFEGKTPEQVKAEIGRITDPTLRAEAESALPSTTTQPALASSGSPPSIQYRDRRQLAQDEGYGAKEGAGLYEEKKTLGDLYTANSKLISQLNLLENIYKNPGVPEGELAPQIQTFRSALKSIGINVSEGVGLSDLANSVAIGMALGMKNADGKNLLPGAMSNYEDQLLQKMAPTLGRSQEGRMALISFMKAVAGSNIRLAQEATKLSSENKDRLPASWEKRKERIMLEEMVKLKMLSAELMSKYGGRM